MCVCVCVCVCVDVLECECRCESERKPFVLLSGISARVISRVVSPAGLCLQLFVLVPTTYTTIPL